MTGRLRRIRMGPSARTSGGRAGLFVTSVQFPVGVISWLLTSMRAYQKGLEQSSCVHVLWAVLGWCTVRWSGGPSRNALLVRAAAPESGPHPSRDTGVVSCGDFTDCDFTDLFSKIYVFIYSLNVIAPHRPHHSAQVQEVFAVSPPFHSPIVLQWQAPR